MTFEPNFYFFFLPFFPDLFLTKSYIFAKLTLDIMAVEWSLKWWCRNQVIQKVHISWGGATCSPFPSGTQKHDICTLWRIPENVLAQKRYCIFQGHIYLCVTYKIFTWLSKKLHIAHSWKTTVLRLKAFLTHFQQNDWYMLTCIRTTSYIWIMHEIFMKKLM